MIRRLVSLVLATVLLTLGGAGFYITLEEKYNANNPQAVTQGVQQDLHQFVQHAISQDVPGSASLTGYTVNRFSPDAPPTKNLMIPSWGPNYVTLSWEGTPGSLEYLIYRGKSADFKQSYLVTMTKQPYFRDDSVLPGTLYNYWVLAANKKGMSKPSERIIVFTYPTWDELHYSLQDSVVQIREWTTPMGSWGSSELGTGWFAGGYVITNYHMVENAHFHVQVFVHHDPTNRAFHGQEFDAKVVHTDKANDIAVLQLLNTKGWTGPTLTLGQDPSMGTPVGVLGHPGGLQLTMTTGSVVNTGISEPVNNYGTMSDMIETDVASVPGNSGSPLLNRYGQVVGIMESTNTLDGNLSYAVPVSVLGEFGLGGSAAMQPIVVPYR